MKYYFDYFLIKGREIGWECGKSSISFWTCVWSTLGYMTEDQLFWSLGV